MKRNNDRKSGQKKLSLSRETIRELSLRVVSGGGRDEDEDPGTGSDAIGTPQQGGDLRPLCC